MAHFGCNCSGLRSYGPAIQSISHRPWKTRQFRLRRGVVARPHLKVGESGNTYDRLKCFWEYLAKWLVHCTVPTYWEQLIENKYSGWFSASPEEAYEVLTKGWTNRRVASTNMNRESSRSHSLFTLHLETKSKEEDGVIRTKVNVTRNPCQTLNVYSICY